MANTARKTALVVVAAAMLAAPRAVSGADMPATTDAAHAHVRSHSAAILALIQQATDRSVTFRQLVGAITVGDAVVYVEEGECGHGVRACFHAISTAGGHRMLWVKVDTRKNIDEDLMGTIGHELRHTIEALHDPSVKTSAGLFFLYQRIGYSGTGSGSMETKDAVNAGNAVRSEVRAFNRRASLD